MVAIPLTQRPRHSPAPLGVSFDFWTSLYQAIGD